MAPLNSPSHPRRRRALAFLLSTVLLSGLVACTDNRTEGDKQPARAIDYSGLPALEDITQPEWQPETRSEQLAMEIDATLTESGHASLQQAIDAFDLTFLDMPGATPSNLPDGAGLGLSYVRALIEPHRADLSPKQLAVLNSLTGATADASGVAALGGVRLPAEPEPAASARYTALLRDTLADWTRFLAGFPLFDTQLSYPPMDVKVGKEDAGMDALLVGNTCQIRIFPAFLTQSRTDESVKIFFAHELFHCRQFLWNRAMGSLPDWIVEGSADFAAFDLYRRSSIPLLPEAGVAASWFSNQRRPLSSRSYDAWPLYETIFQTGGAVYDAIKTLVSSGGRDTAAALASIGMDSLNAQLLWSSLASRTVSITPAKDWMLDWPSQMTTAGPKDNYAAVAERGIGSFAVTGSDRFSQLVQAGYWANDVGLTTVVPKRGVMQTVAKSGTVVAPEGEATLFCFDSGGCVCPEDEESGAIPMTGHEMLFAFPASAHAVTASVVNDKWDPDKYCHEKGKKRAVSNGDPHLFTFDGLAYDANSLAEFVTTRDPKGGLEVQSRHEMYGSDVLAVTTVEPGAVGTTAIAVKAGKDHRVTFTAKDLAKTSTISVRLDGKAVGDDRFDAGEVRVEAGHNSKSNRTWTLVWPDKSQVTLTWAWGFFVSIELPAKRASRMVGMLGSADHDLRNDLILPSGKALPLKAELEKDFAAAWRVDGKTSLFDYEPGKSFASYRKKSPKAAVVPALEGISDCTQSLGHHATSYEIDSCAYDVTVTGIEDFLRVYRSITATRVQTQGISSFPGQAAPESSQANKRPVAPKAGVPSLTLAGTILSGTEAGTPKISGAVTIARGSVVLIRADCRPKVTLWVVVTRTGQSRSVSPQLCASNGRNDYAYTAVDGDDSTNGESYALVTTPGDYSFALRTDATEKWAVSVEVFVDPTPTIVPVEQTNGTGYTGTLSGIGDSVVLQASNNGGPSSWNATGFDKACFAVNYVGALDKNQDDYQVLQSVCHHGTQILLSSVLGNVTPIVLFNRLAQPLKITVRPR